MYKNSKFPNRKKKLLVSNVIIYFIFILLLFFIFVYFMRVKEKRVLFISEAKDMFCLANIDLSRRELVLVNIPKNVQVEVSRNLGQWELGSVWKLGEQEKIGGGRLLVDTIRNNFFVPVYLWMPYQDKFFAETNVLSKFKYFIFPSSSNIRINVRLRLFWISLVGFREVNEFDLTDTTMLVRAVLKTGEDGFLIEDDLPQDLRVYLREPLLDEIFVSIVNESGNSMIVGKIGKLIEMMGGKLISVKNENISNTDCFVYSRDLYLANAFSLVFNCQVSRSSPFSLNDNEIVLRLGKDFVARW